MVCVGGANWNCFFGLVGKVVVSVKGAYFSDTISSQAKLAILKMSHLKRLKSWLEEWKSEISFHSWKSTYPTALISCCIPIWKFGRLVADWSQERKTYLHWNVLLSYCHSEDVHLPCWCRDGAEDSLIELSCWLPNSGRWPAWWKGRISGGIRPRFSFSGNCAVMWPCGGTWEK